MAETRKRPSTNLTRARIVDQAIDLIEREGEEALSMRRLGSALGVQAMSLYHHVDNREELTEAIAQRLLEPTRELELGTDWRQAATVFGRSLRTVAVQHPRAFRLVGLKPLDAPRAEAERLIAVFEAAGASREKGLVLYRAVASYARGYALAEASGFTLGADEIDADEAFERGLEALLSGFESP
jgi:TetR/AcrR family tetracycline transcriptional repressor